MLTQWSYVFLAPVGMSLKNLAHIYAKLKSCVTKKLMKHYNDVIMGAIASQIASLAIVYSIVYPDAYQRKHQSSVSLAFVWGIHRGPVNSPHKWPVTRKMFPFDDVIMAASVDPSLDLYLPCLSGGWLLSVGSRLEFRVGRSGKTVIWAI